MERQQFMDYYHDEWESPQVISNYHEEEEDISVQDILKRARTFKISSKSFELPTYERQIKGSWLRTMQMSSGHDFERNKYHSDIYYPDMSECLDSTLDGSNMMQPFSHGWLLQKGSGIKRTITDKDERSPTLKSCLNTHDTADLKSATPETPKQTLLEYSLDDYERTIERARQIAEKYSVTEDPIKESSEEESVTFVEKLKSKADDAPVQRSCESCLETELKAVLIENSKPEPIDNSLDDYERTIERARQIAEKYSVTEDLITNSFSTAELKPDLKENPKQEPVNGSLDDYENTIEQARQIAEKYCVTEDPISDTPTEKPVTFFEKLKLKSDDAPLERSCEETSDLPKASYFQKLKSKREEILDSTAEICVKAALNKMRRELYVEAIREIASKQKTILETSDLVQNVEQHNVVQSKIFDPCNIEDIKKPKVSLLSSAHGFQWMEETKTPKRKSWRKRIGGLFCLRRCGNVC